MNDVNHLLATPPAADPVLAALTPVDDAVLLRVRVQPRASRTRLEGIADDGTLRVRLQAPPVDGAANATLVVYLAREVLGLAPSQLTLVRGDASRSKVLAVRGLDASTIAERLRRSLADA